MDNAEPGPGPSTARIKFTLPAGARLPLVTAENGVAQQPPYSTAGMGHSAPHQDGANPRPATRGNRRRRGQPRSRGGGATSSRHQPPRHSSVRASTRISQLSDADHPDSNNTRKLTLSFNKNGASKQGVENGRKTSFLGEYDRDLDENPTEPLAFEEQFILRVPESIAGSLRDMVKGKAKGLEGVEFKFLDTRRAAFKYEGKTYASKLVDLPNIIESQKTFDSRHLFKVADISQMMIVENSINEESQINSSSLNVDDYIWPHGLTPPLKHVRKRRFRKRISRRAIEVVEEHVEELLGKDEGAEDIQTDLIDVNPGVDVPDSYYIEYDPDAVWYQNADAEGSDYGGSEMYDDPGSVVPQSDLDEQGFYDDRAGSELFDGSDEDVYDDDLAAALREEMADVSDDNAGSDDGERSGDDEDEEGARSGDDEEDDDVAEKKDKIKQFTGEIKILETTIEKKRNGFTGGNPIMVKRFEETIAGLQADVNTKVSARQSLLAELESITLAKAQIRKSLEPDMAPASSQIGSAGRKAAVNITAGEEDGEDDADGTGPDTPTPDIRRTEPEEEEDLFGDDEDYDDDSVHSNAQTYDDRAERIQEYPEEESASEPEAELDEEMAALLKAELDEIDLPEEGTEDAATLRQLQDLEVEGEAVSGDIDMGEGMSSAAQRPGFGVEGGVGMRRLANGLLDDGDGSSDSDDSDD